jgi:predicted TIM-barrel fold metal-dependent hydrolase
MNLFDSNCMLGRLSIHTPLGQPFSVTELLAEMDRLGISEALVFHAMALDGHPAEGNERLMREIEGQLRLHPCWVLLPTCGEMPPPAKLVSQMKKRGVRAARMCPVRHRYLFTNGNIGDLLAELERARIPVFVDFDMRSWSEEKTDWRSLDELCGRYPKLPFIVVGEGFGAPRRVFPLWERHRNLYLETSYYQPHQGLSDVARRFGPERLLFGTGLPYKAPGCPLAQLRYDFLTDKQRSAIGGGNLRRLLAVSPSRRAAISSTATELPHHPIIDAHVHLGTWFSSYVHEGEADGLIRSMDRLNIRAMALIAFDSIAADMRGGNDRVFAAMQKYPGRFLGYATVDPNEPKAMAKELDRCFDKLGFHAIKFHCGTHGVPADHDAYRAALEFANRHGLAVLIHGHITAKMLEMYPRAQFLSAHVGGWEGRQPHYAVELAKRHPNIHMELCSSAVFNGVMERLVAEVGADRIVHGSDAPLMDPGFQLGRVLAAKISSADKRKILHDNAARLFHLSERSGTRGAQ